MNQYVTVSIKDTDVHHFGVQIDAAVMLAVFGIELHLMPPSYWTFLSQLKFRRLPIRGDLGGGHH